MAAESADPAGGPTTPAERDVMLAGVYDEVRMAAVRMMRRKGLSADMRATDNADAAALRHQDPEHMTWQDQQAFFTNGARTLRHAMVDAVRLRRHSSDAGHLGSPEVDAGYDPDMLDSALLRLEGVSPELAQLVELRIFVGLSIVEIATLHDQSKDTVLRRWKAAQLWLANEMQPA
jgi:RNA polymerase sigma factor (TIGR02999 family)